MPFDDLMAGPQLTLLSTFDYHLLSLTCCLLQAMRACLFSNAPQPRTQPVHNHLTGYNILELEETHSYINTFSCQDWPDARLVTKL